jgi:hypothetical protein
MVRATRWILAQSLLLVFASSSSWADECDPSKILLFDSANRSLQIKEKLDQKSTTDTADTRKQGSTGSFSFLDMFTASRGESADFTSTLKKTFSSFYEGQYQSAESYLQLSDNAKEAFKACLESKTKHLFIYPSNDVMGSTDTFVAVKLESYVESKEVKVTIRVDGAKLAKGQADTLAMSPGGTENIRIVRDLDKPFTVHVRAGNETEYLSVSAQNKFKLVREISSATSGMVARPARSE